MGEATGAITLNVTYILAAALALVSAIGTLSAAIGHLWRTLSKINAMTREELRQCHEQHQAANEHIIELAEKVGRLSGMDEMKRAVIKEIKSLKKLDQSRAL